MAVETLCFQDSGGGLSGRGERKDQKTRGQPKKHNSQSITPHTHPVSRAGADSAGYHGGGTLMADLNPRITVEPGKMGGKPCIRGLRFTVYDLASYLASGMTEDEILRDFPYLEKEDFQAVFEFFASIPKGSPCLKLLVDENLAPRLAGDLVDLFPGSIHVSSAELGRTPDGVIWNTRRHMDSHS